MRTVLTSFGTFLCFCDECIASLLFDTDDFFTGCCFNVTGLWRSFSEQLLCIANNISESFVIKCL